MNSTNLTELREAPMPGDWAQRAACRGRTVNSFFPSRGMYGPPRWFLELCRDCPVLTCCRTYALRYPVKGLWAGMSEDERRQRRAERRAS